LKPFGIGGQAEAFHPSPLHHFIAFQLRHPGKPLIFNNNRGHQNPNAQLAAKRNSAG
jgi:hypothetical protein